MFGERLVYRGAMRIANRNRRRICRNALPDQFDKPKSLFDRELQNLGNVSVAHGGGANRRAPIIRPEGLDQSEV